MKILIVAATELEIKPFLNELDSFQDKPDVLITGVGTPFVVYHLLKKLQEQSYDLVINAGIAGAFNESLQIGELLRVEHDEFADLGIESKNGIVTCFEAGFANPNEFPFTKGRLVPSKTETVFDDLRKASAITVNLAHGTKANCDLFKNKYKADLESMEGAAVFYTCMNEDVSCIQIRAVSNYVKEKEEAQWNISLAVENLNSYLVRKLR